MSIGRGGAFFWSKVFKNIIGGGGTGDQAGSTSEAVGTTRPSTGEIAVSQGEGVASAGGEISSEAGATLAGSGGAAGALVGKGDGQGPKWVPPKWASDVHPGVQAAASVLLYFFHMVGRDVGGVGGISLLWSFRIVFLDCTVHFPNGIWNEGEREGDVLLCSETERP